MSIESAIEQKIREAMERGEFDNLAGKGKPIDLTAYFNTPEDLRMAYSMLRSNEFVPHEVELMREIATLHEELKQTEDDAERAHKAREIEQKRLTLKLSLENQLRRR
jgi:hypothetical protein